MKRSWFLALVAACSGSEQAATVDLPVTTSAAPLAVATTDLGYAISIDELRIAVSTIQFTIEGESHTQLAPRIAAPHPGHSAGGEVTGELPGNFVLVWNGSTQPVLGTATLIAGNYFGANFTFRAATADDVAATDPLLGHTFHVRGSATKAGATVRFDAVLDVEPDSAVVGAVFEATITESSTAPLSLVFVPTDATENDTPFDGIEFSTLPTTAGTVEIRPGSAEHNLIRRAIQTHDHYAVTAR